MIVLIMLKNGVNITKTLLKSMATSFCEHLEKNGFYAGIYTNEDYIKINTPRRYLIGSTYGMRDITQNLIEMLIYGKIIDR